MGSYQEHALESASAVELVVALYDGIIRFLYAATAAVERGDEAGRRIAVKRAMDIIIHLQARLSEFYATMFSQILQASQSASLAKFEHAIGCVRNVRDAWREVARDPEVNPAPLQVMQAGRHGSGGFDGDEYGAGSGGGSSWNA
jgi:flagellar protein FliS